MGKVDAPLECRLAFSVKEPYPPFDDPNPPWQKHRLISAQELIFTYAPNHMTVEVAGHVVKKDGDVGRARARCWFHVPSYRPTPEPPQWLQELVVTWQPTWCDLSPSVTDDDARAHQRHQQRNTRGMGL